jgi:hypothetical protein
LNQSSFNIGGLLGKESDGLRAFVFTDRGIYRPGETVHIAMTVNEADLTQKLENVPVVIHILGPDSRILTEKKLSLGKYNQANLDFSTRDFFASGKYQIRVYLHEADTSKKPSRKLQYVGAEDFQVEDFEPDQLQLGGSFATPPTAGWSKPDQLVVKATVKTLYGSAVENAIVQISARLIPPPRYLCLGLQATNFQPWRSTELAFRLLTLSRKQIATELLRSLSTRFKTSPAPTGPKLKWLLVMEVGANRC